MELFLIIGAIALLYWFFKRSNSNSSSSQNYTPPSSGRSETSNLQTRRKDPRVHSPRRTSSARPKIKFNGEGGATASHKPPTVQELEGLHDAFTGQPLNLALGLFQCSSCQVYYHTASYQVLADENSGRCVACSSPSIAAVSGHAHYSGGRDYNPDIITLENFHSHVGRVIVFEGYVHKVLQSKRGKDYAVMFENKSWTKGFKLVFFRGSISKVGGARYINALKGKTIRVRGLLINHKTFGHEIIISEKSMILDASR